MFNPESEDLLPRSAPKPSATAASESIAKPTVPEVSILFNQDGPGNGLGLGLGQQQQSTQNQHISYASWKKKSLPQVTYSSQDPTQNVVTRSSVYPMRQVVSKISNGMMTGASGTVQLNSIQSETYPRRNSIGRVGSDQMYHSSPPSNAQYPVASSNLAYSIKQAMTTNAAVTYSAPQRTEFIEIPPKRSNADVLTICAGTQTTEFSSKEETFATKQDIQEIFSYLQEIRLEQQRIIRMLEKKSEESTPEMQTKILKDAGTQCNFVHGERKISPPKRVPVICDYIAEESSEDVLSSPYCKLPINSGQTPKTIPQRQAHQTTPRSNTIPLLPKPATEQSLVMNELALKYLPSDKLSDLLQEIRLQSADDSDSANSPLRNIENVSKNPNEISSASYKYLKKYRLLSEDGNNSPNGNYNPREGLNYENRLENRYLENHEENHLDLDAIRRKPKFL